MTRPISAKTNLMYSPSTSFLKEERKETIMCLLGMKVQLLKIMMMCK